MPHTEATLNGLNKMNFDITGLTSKNQRPCRTNKKVGANAAIVKNATEKLVGHLVEAERHYWATLLG